MIKEFKGDYAWLSNFAPVKIILNETTYPSVEHAYMSAKNEDPSWKFYCSLETNSAGTVKRKSRTIVLRSDWEQIKVDVMGSCLQQKFNQQPFRDKLIATGDVFIQEGNWWGDVFWGVNLKTGEGKNILGNLIMEIRKDLQK